MACSPDGSLVATASDFALVVFRTSDGTLVAKYGAAHAHYVTHVAFSADGKLIASASQDGTIMIWKAPVVQSLSQPSRKDSHISAPLRLAREESRSAMGTGKGSATGAHRPIQRQASFEDLSPAHLARDVDGSRRAEKAHDHVHVKMTRSLHEQVTSNFDSNHPGGPFLHEP